MGIRESDPRSQLTLPPGFRFYPTDEELVVQYLCRKVAGHHFSLQIIGDVDLYKFDAWDLPEKALFGEKEWYFFSPRDRKYPNGSRPNRMAGSGYWKATGTDKIITTDGRNVGIKKALVFYIGKAPKGTKTNWIMHEYRLSDSPKTTGSKRLDNWVLCRIYKKNETGQKPDVSQITSSFKNFDENEDQKQNVEWLGSIWPDFGQPQNMYAPPSVRDEEVQSGSDFYLQNMSGFGFEPGFPADPFGVRNTPQSAGVEFRR